MALPLSVTEHPGEILYNFWKNKKVISDRSRQKGLQYAVKGYPDNTATYQDVSALCAEDSFYILWGAFAHWLYGCLHPATPHEPSALGATLRT